MFEPAIGELEISDSSILKKLADLNDCRVTSKGLQLKLTEESIDTLIDIGAIGLLSNGDSVQGNNLLENVPVEAQPTKGCCNSSASCLCETVIGELELADLSRLDKLLDLNDTRVTSKGLGLKLTNESIQVLIESGIIGVPSDMNGQLSDFNSCANKRNVTKKERQRNLKMPCDKPSTVVERKHQTRQRCESASPQSSQHNVEYSTQESSKQQKQPVRNKIPPEVPKSLPVKRATRSTAVRRGKRLAVFKSSEDEDNDKESPSKVSVTIDMIGIKSPVSQSQAVNTSPSKLNNKVSTTNGLKVATKNDLICDMDDFKTTSESEPSDNSLKSKRSKNHKVSFKTFSPNGYNAGAPQKLTNIRTVGQALSSSEEDNILATSEHSRTENSQSEFKSTNIQSILQRYNMKPDVLAQNIDLNVFSCFWEQAGPDAQLVVLRKQNRSKTCYSLAIVTD